MNTIINHQSKKMGFFAKIKDGLLAIPREHKGFGKQTFMLAKDDLIKNYKGAIIGPAWAIMKPLFQLFVYWFAFTVGLRGGAGRQEMGVPFFIFLMVGFLPWCFMSDTISAGSKCIRSNRQFVNKISFPVSCIMTYTTISKFYVHIFLFSIGYLYLALVGIMPSIYNLRPVNVRFLSMPYMVARSNERFQQGFRELCYNNNVGFVLAFGCRLQLLYY